MLLLLLLLLFLCHYLDCEVQAKGLQDYEMQEYICVGNREPLRKDVWMSHNERNLADKNFHFLILKLNSVALVRERTIPTERPPPVGEISANFCG